MKLEKAIEKTKELIEQGQKFTFDDKKTPRFDTWRIHVAEIVLPYTKMEADRRLVEIDGIIPDKKFYRITINSYDPDYFNRGVNIWTTKLQSILEHLEDRQEQSFQNEKLSSSDKNQVFIVHGHDGEMLDKVELFLLKTAELKHLKPVVLKDQLNGGRTIIEKLEQVAEGACFAIVLYSPDDEGRSKLDGDCKARARQNVVWEHGYFVAKLGRTHVVAIHKNSDDLEIPSDLQGLIYLEFESDWKTDLLKELQGVGLA
ncbi:MAG: TIR domain-containing protein [Vampirovibrionales bacterium]